MPMLKEEEYDDLAAELLESVADRDTDGVCLVVVHNNTRPEHNLVIVAGGCRFMYRDGTHYDDIAKNLYVPSGQSTDFRSDDANKCVYKTSVRLIVEITVGGKRVKRVMARDSKEAPTGKCTLRDEFQITSGKSKSEDESHIDAIDIFEVE